VRSLREVNGGELGRRKYDALRAGWAHPTSDLIVRRYGSWNAVLQAAS
jgi:hypothetical protein